MDIKELFLKQKQATHQGTLGVLAKIPPDHVGWRPAEGMLSLGEIVRHVWMSEEGCVARRWKKNGTITSNEYRAVSSASWEK